MVIIRKCFNFNICTRCDIFNYLYSFKKKKVFVTFIILLYAASFIEHFRQLISIIQWHMVWVWRALKRVQSFLIMRILWKWENQHNRYALRKYGFLASWNNISHSKGQNWAVQSVSSFLSNLVSSFLLEPGLSSTHWIIFWLECISGTE